MHVIISLCSSRFDLSSSLLTNSQLFGSFDHLSSLRLRNCRSQNWQKFKQLRRPVRRNSFLRTTHLVDTSSIYLSPDAPSAASTFHQHVELSAHHYAITPPVSNPLNILRRKISSNTQNSLLSLMIRSRKITREITIYTIKY